MLTVSGKYEKASSSTLANIGEPACMCCMLSDARNEKHMKQGLYDCSWGVHLGLLIRIGDCISGVLLGGCLVKHYPLTNGRALTLSPN